MQNVSFRLITTAGVRVSGYVRHSFGEPARGIGVRLTALQQHSTYGQGLHTVTEADGTFQFDSVLPGSYVLSAMSSDGERPAFGRLELQVGNSEVNRVTLLLQTAIDIAGVVRIEGAESTRAFSFARNIRRFYNRRMTSPRLSPPRGTSADANWRSTSAMCWTAITPSGSRAFPRITT